MVTTFFQVKPEQPPRKPGRTQINITSVTTKEKLPCQEMQQFFWSKK